MCVASGRCVVAAAAAAPPLYVAAASAAGRTREIHQKPRRSMSIRPPRPAPHRGRHAAALLAESAAVPRSQRLSFGAILLLGRGTAPKQPRRRSFAGPPFGAGGISIRAECQECGQMGETRQGEVPESRLAGRRLRWPSSRGATEEALAGGGLSLSLCPSTTSPPPTPPPLSATSLGLWLVARARSRLSLTLALSPSLATSSLRAHHHP